MGEQELTFSSIGHFSLSQWFRTSSLNAPVLPTVLCWIWAIVVASFTISIIPVWRVTEFNAAESWLSGVEVFFLLSDSFWGQSSIFQVWPILLFVFWKDYNSLWLQNLCWILFQYPWMRRGNGCFWGLTKTFMCQVQPFLLGDWYLSLFR